MDMARRGPSRNLVYLTCFGNAKYFEMSTLCIKSLRTFGAYEGEIFVFSDKDQKFSDLDVKVVKVSGLTSGDQFKCFRTIAYDYFESSLYDKIIYTDTDILAVDKIASFFDHCQGGVSAYQEYGFNTMISVSCGGSLLKARDIEKAYKSWGVNSGFFCMKGNQFKHNMQLWSREIFANLDRINQWSDQPYLNYLILKKKIRFTPFPDQWVMLPPIYAYNHRKFRVSTKTKILLFCWSNLPKSVSDMTKTTAFLKKSSKNKVNISKLLKIKPGMRFDNWATGG
jgi:hypothetical protein